MSSVPVSHYEALRAEMRNLVEQAQRVHEIATQVISTTSSTTSIASSNIQHQNFNISQGQKISNSKVDGTSLTILNSIACHNMDSTLVSTKPPLELNYDVEGVLSDEEFTRLSSAQMSVSSEPMNQTNRPTSLYHGTWPVERTMWASDPSTMNPEQMETNRTNKNQNIDQASVLSFASSSGGGPLDRVLGSPDRLTRRSKQQLDAKEAMVYSFLAMLGEQEHADMSETLFALSTSPESCLAMRQSGCIPLLVQLVQSDKDCEKRKKAAQALQNLVCTQPDEKIRKREMRVLKLLNQTNEYVEALRNNVEFSHSTCSSTSESSDQNGEHPDKHPVSIIANIMKHSFDEGHRQAICHLGGIYMIATLVDTEHALHGIVNNTASCILMRRYACMALTNLTFGDSGNKALLCSQREFMRALVVQLQSVSDELRQVTASVLRNLSWRADQTSKEILREVGTVTGLMKAGMATSKENTLKSILSALWNLSAHCTENKLEICAVENGLGFLVAMLSFKAPSSSLTINENAGGILRNISSQIAVRDDYREVLRQHNCLQVLLEQLKSPSLTIVSNACGTLWNLSAKNQVDQEALWQMGAPAMLRSLNHSKHKMIATGSSAALKNLLNSRPSHSLLPQLDATARAMDLPALPTLGARKQKALLRDFGDNLAETFENIEHDSPVKGELDENSVSGIIQCKHRLGQASSAKSEKSHEFQEIINEFAALHLSEASTSSHAGSHGLRKKYDVSEEPEEAEEPVDYTKKYSETNKPREEKKTYDGIYAETDLDQLTDYSLRYAEDDSDSDCDKKTHEFVQDTLKTYYTEGTPYETPINFSTATSLSDLRIVDPIDNDKTAKTRDKDAKPSQTLSHLDEKDHCSVEDITDLDITGNASKCNQKLARSEYSSGLMSPEKPVNYCEEGTPGYFSRVSSFGSLCDSSNTHSKQDLKDEHECRTGTPPPRTASEVKKVDHSPGEGGKAVKFENNANCAEQTPLMFSRSSSLASLDSVEQHSIHDDHSSFVSDLSRLTSGIVSPSELPDSPTQTVPPSPRPRKAIEYPSTSRFAAGSVPKRMSVGDRTSADGRPQPAPRNLIPKDVKPSVFEDNVTKFKEESTPAQFSTATSISSLTIDDQDEHVNGDLEKTISAKGNEENAEKVDDQEKSRDVKSSVINAALSDDDEDEDILADCINIGMHNIRQRQTKQNIPHQSSSKIPSLGVKPLTRPYGSGIPMTRTGIPRSVLPCTNKASQSNINETPADSTRTYCTEDTPAMLSHAGSNSDLSVLSIQTDIKSPPKAHHKEYLSDDSSVLSGDNENILAECIQSAMPKAKVNVKHRSRMQKTHKAPTSTPIKTFAKVEAATKRALPYLETARDEVSAFAVENSPCQFSVRSSLSDLTVEGSIVGSTPIRREVLGDQAAAETDSSSKTVHNTTGASANELSRHESLSSLSVESFGSMETEQALLEQCISSGMPKKSTRTGRSSQDKPIGVATKQFSKLPVHRSQTPEKENEQKPSKNVNAASAAENTRVAHLAADEGENRIDQGIDSEKMRANNAKQVDRQAQLLGEVTTSLVRSSHTDVNLLTSPMKSGCDKKLANMLDVSASNSSYSNSDNCANLDKSDDDFMKMTSAHIVDSRMLDPDAMIESLDRFTAELVSQVTCNKDDKCSNSFIDTWNDDPTFPSLSGSALNVITFSDKPQASDGCSPEPAGLRMDVVDAPGSNDFSSMNTSTMTDSTLIALEAQKIADTFQTEAEMNQSARSFDLGIENVQPPSHMDSISSGIDLVPAPIRSPRLARKKSLPSGMMARRALNNSINQVGSLECLIGQNSFTNLEQVNPPSLMDELIDMEGSLISVASITSDNGHSQAMLTVRNPPISSQVNSLCDLNQINPPSLFNEVTDLCNSLDVVTDLDTTEVFEDCHTYQQTENDVTEPFSDANSVTPIQSDLSSAESTPKKTRVLTPKEKRSLEKERYLTYTIESDKLTSRDDESVTEDYRTARGDSSLHTAGRSEMIDSYKSVAENGHLHTTYTRSSPKLTPKERRKHEQARYQTQILSKEVVENAAQATNSTSTSANESNLLNRRQMFNQTRQENKDRFRTRTISATCISRNTPSPDTMSRLHQGANVVLTSLDDSRTDELLDETISLVSDEDSGENSRCSITYRTYRKSSSSMLGRIPVIPPLVQSETRPELESDDNSEELQEAKAPGKPKIVKPNGRGIISSPLPDKELGDKAIRGRRKPLYSKAFKSMPVRPTTPPSKLLSKPPVASQLKLQKAKTAPIQREGTFTMEDKKPTGKISSAIPKAASTSRIAKSPASTQMGQRSKLPSYGGRNGLVKSASSDRANKPIPRVYNRSPSVDSRIVSMTGARKPISLALPTTLKTGTVKKTPEKKPVSSNSTTINEISGASNAHKTNGTLKETISVLGNIATSNAGKQITSRIASLWKQVEENKKKQKDHFGKEVKVWAQPVRAGNETPAQSPTDTSF